MSGYFRFANLDQLIIGVIRGYYIKYQRLAMLINTQFKNSSATSVDMYIDLMDIFCKVDKAITDDSLALENPLAITSAIINLTAHYRNFFYSWYKCTTRFWIINAKSNSLSTKYYPGFEERTLSPMMNRLYELNVETLKMLCNYINDIQYEECTVEFVTKALSIAHYHTGDPDLMNGLMNDKNVKIALSKDVFTLQICKYPNFYTLIPKKVKGEDLSYIADNDTTCSFYFSKIKNERTICAQTADKLPALMALTKVPSRGLKSKYMYGTVLKHVQDPTFIGSNNPMEYIEDYISRYVKKATPQDIYEVQCRLRAVDATTIQLHGYYTTAEYLSYNGIVNLYDPKSVKEINNQYFRSCPLDLIVL